VRIQISTNVKVNSGGVNMKIKHKISLIAAIMCIVCVGSMWALNSFILSQYLEDTIKDKISAEVKLKANDINTWIANEKRNLDVIVERVLRAKDYSNDTLYEVLAESGAMNNGYYYYLTFEDGTLIDGSGWIPDEDYDPLTREWYVKTKENDGKIYVADPYVDVKTNDLVLTLAKEIKLKDGREVVLGVDMEISDMNQLVNSIGQRSVDTLTSATMDGMNYENTINKSEESYIFLIDSKGNIINHPNPDFTLKSDKVTNAADILEGKLNNLIKIKNLSLHQRIVKDYDGEERVFFFDKLDEADWTIGIAVDRDSIFGIQDKFAEMTLFISIVLLGVGVVVSYIIAGSIAKPIKTAKTVANNIAQLRLDVDVDEEYLRRKDEAGEIVKAIKGTEEKLRGFVADLNDLVTINDKIYSTTSEKVNNLLSLSEEVSAMTEELTAGMEETSAATDSISQSVDKLNSSISAFASKADEGAKTANEIARKALELNSQFIDSKDNTMNILNVAKNEIESAVESAKNVEQVKMLADAILDIAEKTSLLALNASIEAARAGENGKGFAVVAEEIRKLADDSNQSAEGIKQFAENISISVNDLISATNNLLKFLNENVLNDYSLMLNAVENYKNDGSLFSGVLLELSNMVDELETTINTVTASINNVFATIQQTTAATTNIAEQNNQMVREVQDINNVMQMNLSSSHKLTNMIGQVKM